LPVVKNLPKSESGVGILCKYKGEQYQISQNPEKIKGRFTLWKITSSGYERLQSADDTVTLENIVFQQKKKGSEDI